MTALVATELRYQRRGDLWDPAIDALLGMAHALGVEVATADLGDYRRGEYRHGRRQIVLCERLDGRQVTETLGHEIAHALLSDGGGTPTIEVRARMLGAALTASVRCPV